MFGDTNLVKSAGWMKRRGGGSARERKRWEEKCKKSRRTNPGKKGRVPEKY